MTDSQKLDLILAKIENQDTTINTLKDEIKLTREEFKSNIAEVREELKTDIAEVREELKTDIAEVREELKADIAEVREELKTDIAEVREELKADIAELRENLTAINERISAVRDELYQEIKNIHLLIENELRSNIQMIAECHLDLHRKVQQVILSRQEFEQMYIRVNVLETEVRQIKMKIS